MKTTNPLAALLIPAMLLLVCPMPRTTLADISVRVLPHQVTADEVCGTTFTGRCEEAVWCDDWYIPVAVPFGDAVASAQCGGHFGAVFEWGASGYGEAQAFGPFGPGGPIRVASWVEWNEFGPAAFEFRVHTLGLYEFLDSWFAGDGDFNSDDTTSAQDIFDFLAAWAS